MEFGSSDVGCLHVKTETATKKYSINSNEDEVGLCYFTEHGGAVKVYGERVGPFLLLLSGFQFRLSGYRRFISEVYFAKRSTRMFF